MSKSKGSIGSRVPNWVVDWTAAAILITVVVLIPAGAIYVVYDHFTTTNTQSEIGLNTIENNRKRARLDCLKYHQVNNPSFKAKNLSTRIVDDRDVWTVTLPSADSNVTSRFCLVDKRTFRIINANWCISEATYTKSERLIRWSARYQSLAESLFSIADFWVFQMALTPIFVVFVPHP